MNYKKKGKPHLPPKTAHTKRMGTFSPFDIVIDIFLRENYPPLVMLEGQEFPYKEAELYDAKGDVKKRWYIEYKVWDKDKHKLEKIRHWISSREYPKAFQRRQYAARYCRDLNKHLKAGYVRSELAHRQKKVKNSTDSYKNAIEHINELLDIFAKQLRPSSLPNYTYTIKDFITFLEAKGKKNILLAEIEQPLIIEFLDWSQTSKANFSNTSRNNRLSFIRPFFTKLKEKGLIDKNPASNISTLKETEAKHIAYSDSDIVTIKEAVLQKWERPDLWFFICFIYYGFMRPTSEVRQLKIRNIKLKEGVVYVESSISKNRIAKYPVISNGFGKEILNSGILSYPSNYYIFTKDKRPGLKPVGKNYYSMLYRKIMNELGYNHEYTLYSWKHTGNVKAVEAGINIYDIKKQNGHASLEETDRYLRSLNAVISSDLKGKQVAI